MRVALAGVVRAALISALAPRPRRPAFLQESGNAFLGKDFFKNYVTEDISLAYGGFWNVVDNFLSPATRQYDIGVSSR